ncbi:MAG TPA: peptide-methionine (S)-S-oxide reductase MsrA [Vicinamibacterales bacterium]|jgi:peptide-methionine (S)-S-oxide reductase|nr:peptide-methionine (S)-S-oxide reductase MsrA [Vicinamibacterales bacterium]
MTSARGKTLVIAAAVSLSLFWIVGRTFSVEAESAHVVPAPVADVPAGGDTRAVAVVAGGCFWGVQGVFQHVKGVTSAVSGYAGGEKKTADYDTVGTGLTGHAESVQITFNPQEISFGTLLRIYFSVVHDPTELNRQGPDEGKQYRSTIFAATAAQADVATAYIAQLNGARAFKKPIATTIETGRTFYTAEAYHQDFLTLNPTYPYIEINDIPKVKDLKKLFPESYQEKPVLVNPPSLSSKRQD